jgi:hypothetical protein
MSFVTIHVEKAVFEVVDTRDVFDLEVEADARCPGLAASLCGVQPAVDIASEIEVYRGVRFYSVWSDRRPKLRPPN